MKRRSRTDIAGTLAAAAGAALSAYVCAVRPWHLRWGASDDEVREALPGDELVPHPKSVSTRALTVRARPEEVWPWLAQVGEDRGGFYSYSWIFSWALVVSEERSFGPRGAAGVLSDSPPEPYEQGPADTPAESIIGRGQQGGGDPGEEQG